MASVPKFGSFKPKKVASGQSAHQQPERQRDERSASNSRKEDSSRHRHERRHNRDDFHDERQRRKRHHDRHRSSHTRQRKHEPVEDIVVPHEFEESDLFLIDRRGDSKNVEYGSLHRYSVPAYHRVGYGRLVGAAQSLRLDREQSTDTSAVLSFVADKERTRLERPLKSKRLTASEKKLRLIAPAVPSADDMLRSQSDWIALRPGLKRKRESASPEPVNTIDYRSIEGKAKAPTHPSDSDLASDSDSDKNFTQDTIELRIRQENAALSKQTKQAPQDVETWLKLIAHQTKVICPHGDRPSFGDKRTIADLRLAIYDQAMRHIQPGDSGHERLLLGMLEDGAVIWETSKLARQWTEALTRCPTSIALWTKYLDFIQADHVNFSYEACKAAYLQCLRILRNARTAGDRVVEVAPAQIWVTLRLTAFIRDAGYDELAYSIWQILLELTFFKPAGLTNDSAILQSLEDYWDADVPRIGEEDASGWAHHAGGEAASAARKVTSQALSSEGTRQSIQQFADRESEIQSRLHLPASVDDDDESTEDPYRQVLFADVKPVIENLLADLPSEDLINAFLMFMGLPLPASSRPDGPSRKWQLDPHLSRAEQVDRKALVAGFAEQTTLSLFGDAFGAFKQRVAQHSAGSTELASFIDRVLERIITVRSDDDSLAEYYLAFKLGATPVEAPKLARRLLKARPTSIRLYNAYALVEAHSDRIPKAQEVWKTAISMSGQFANGGKDDLVLLWHSWIFCLLRAGDERNALCTLLAMLDNDPGTVAQDGDTVPAARRLKASRFFEEMWERSIHSGKSHLAVLYAECHTWFVYLISGRSIVSAADVLAKYAVRAEESRKRVAEELIYQAQASLVRAHLQHHRPYKPADVRSALSKGLRKFPNNGLLIDMYARVGSQSRIEDRLRYTLSNDEVGNESSLVTWAHFLAEEVRRCDEEASGSTAISVRSSFKRALLSPDSHVKHSIALWTMWLRFESSRIASKLLSTSSAQDQKNVALVRARQVFLDGLRMLPWSKSWIISGLGLFSHEGGMSERELMQVYRILSERELRLRVDMSEPDDGIADAA